MPKRRTNVKGFIYLLHFHRPYKHARHYTGWAKDLMQRVGQHFDGTSSCSRLIQAALSEGIGFDIARVWKGKTRNDERQMKIQGGASRRCPICIEEKREARKALHNGENPGRRPNIRAELATTKRGDEGR